MKEPEKAEEPLDHKACGTPAEDRAQEGGLGEERVTGSICPGKIWASEDSLSPRCPWEGSTARGKGSALVPLPYSVIGE